MRKLAGTELKSLRPEPLRQYYGLTEQQYLFGDCGAFSYVNEEAPAISVEQAVALYELYNFDLGASVDHIPFKTLSEPVRQERVVLTRDNAAAFIATWQTRGRLFTPVGTLQGTNPKQYADNVETYYDMGYRHLAIGGLVPLRDEEILAIVRAVSDEANRLQHRPWIHLFGIFRPHLQAEFRNLRIDNFDSASYFRKAWLRSSQNYLDVGGKWYSAIRVPMVNDSRTAKRLQSSGADIERYRELELTALQILRKYDRGDVGVEEALDAVLACDSQLEGASEIQSMRDRYRRTLQDKPWLNCRCSFCTDLGIQILIFRGANRNKRRGAHNTLGLYSHLNAQTNVKWEQSR